MARSKPRELPSADFDRVPSSPAGTAFCHSRYSSNPIRRSTNPSGVISTIRLASVEMNSWSCEANSMTSGKAISPLFSAVMVSRSRWLVGSSRISALALASIILESMQRTLSPPERTEVFFSASSPEKSILPRKPRAKLSPSAGGLYWRSHSTRFSSFAKYALFSFGK